MTEQQVYDKIVEVIEDKKSKNIGPLNCLLIRDLMNNKEAKFHLYSLVKKGKNSYGNTINDKYFKIIE
jgi:hypothetical protein